MMNEEVHASYLLEEGHLRKSMMVAPSHDDEEKKVSDEDAAAKVAASYKAPPNLFLAPRTTLQEAMPATTATEAETATRASSRRSSKRSTMDASEDLSIYTNSNKNKTTTTTTTTTSPSDVISLHSVPPSAAATADDGTHMSIEVVSALEEGSISNNKTPPTIEIVDHQIQDMVNAQVLRCDENEEHLPTREIIRQLSNVIPQESPKTTKTLPPGLVLVDRSPTIAAFKKTKNPFRSDATSTGGGSSVSSLYTTGNGQDASTLTKDTCLQTAAANAANAATTTTTEVVDPEAPRQEASPYFDEYYHYYNDHQPKEDASIGHSTITSLTKDTGMLRTEEEADELPFSNGLMSGENVSYVTPPRGGDGDGKNKTDTPSTARSQMTKDNNDEDYCYSSERDVLEETSGWWKFLQNATRDPTVQCLVTLACIFAVILFFLVAVIIVLTSEDIGLDFR